MIRTAFIAIAALSAFAGVASAETNLPKTQHIQVRLSDIDLSTTSGARVAFGRIQQAATTACGGELDWRASDNQKQEFSACVSKAVRQGVDHSGAPVLIAMVKGDAPALMAKN